MGRKYYAVRKGREPGLYESWAECKPQVAGFPECDYKSFTSKSSALAYLSDGGFVEKQDKPIESPRKQLGKAVYRLEYDGASKGNPGKSGAGALLRHPDGSVIQEMAIGLGEATNNFAEYHGLILGLKAALERNISCIQVHGDSDLVCKQVTGKWAVRNEKLVPLHAEVQALKKQFSKFNIRHVAREFNGAADALANKATGLGCLEVHNVALDNQGLSREDDPSSSDLPKAPEQQLVVTKLRRKKVTEEEEIVAVGVSLPPVDIRKKSGGTTRKRAQAIDSDEEVYQLEFDGASKGNPGRAGGGALLRHPSGKVIEELTMGLGYTTNNVAEYQALILGLQAAVEKKITRIQVIGDSNLVCKQVEGTWSVKNANLIPLHERVRALTSLFKKFSIHHMDRELNTAADTLANRATKLRWNEIKTKPARPVSTELDLETEGQADEFIPQDTSKEKDKPAEAEAEVPAAPEAAPSSPRSRKTRAKKELDVPLDGAEAKDVEAVENKSRKARVKSKKSEAEGAGKAGTETEAGGMETEARTTSSAGPRKTRTKKTEMDTEASETTSSAGPRKTRKRKSETETEATQTMKTSHVEAPCPEAAEDTNVDKTSRPRRTRVKKSDTGALESSSEAVKAEATVRKVPTKKSTELDIIPGLVGGSLSHRTVPKTTDAISRLQASCRSYHRLHPTVLKVHQKATVPTKLGSVFRAPVLSSRCMGPFPKLCVSTVAAVSIISVVLSI